MDKPKNLKRLDAPVQGQQVIQAQTLQAEIVLSEQLAQRSRQVLDLAADRQRLQELLESKDKEILALSEALNARGKK